MPEQFTIFILLLFSLIISSRGQENESCSVMQECSYYIEGTRTGSTVWTPLSPTIDITSSSTSDTTIPSLTFTSDIVPNSTLLNLLYSSETISTHQYINDALTSKVTIEQYITSTDLFESRPKFTDQFESGFTPIDQFESVLTLTDQFELVLTSTNQFESGLTPTDQFESEVTSSFVDVAVTTSYKVSVTSGQYGTDASSLLMPTTISSVIYPTQSEDSVYLATPIATPSSVAESLSEYSTTDLYLPLSLSEETSPTLITLLSIQPTNQQLITSYSITEESISISTVSNNGSLSSNSVVPSVTVLTQTSVPLHTLPTDILYSSIPTTSIPALYSSVPPTSIPALYSNIPTTSIPVLYYSSIPTTSVPALYSSIPPTSIPALYSSVPPTSVPVLHSGSPIVTSTLDMLSSLYYSISYSTSSSSLSSSTTSDIYSTGILISVSSIDGINTLTSTFETSLSLTLSISIYTSSSTSASSIYMSISSTSSTSSSNSISSTSISSTSINSTRISSTSISSTSISSTSISSTSVSSTSISSTSISSTSISLTSISSLVSGITTPSFDVISSTSLLVSSSDVVTTVSDGRVTSSLVSSSSSVLVSPTVLSGFIVRIVFSLSSSERESLVNVSSSKRAQLEESIVTVYLKGLDTLGGQRKRQLSSSPKAYITDVGSLSPVGTAPVDFYMTVNGEPIEASTVIGILNRANPQNISNYEVVMITMPETGTVTMTTSNNSTLYIIIGGTVGGALIIIICVLLVMCMLLGKRNKKGRSEVSHIELQAFATGQEGLPAADHKHMAVQHGSPAINKITRRSVVKRNYPLATTSSTMGLLAASNDVHLDAWQHEQLIHEGSEQPPAGLFEHVTHYSDGPSANSTALLRFHTTIGGQSPSTTTSSGNLVKSVLPVTDTDRKQSRRNNRERIKLQSQQRKIMSRQRSKTGQPVTADLPQRSEAEEGLGDIEGSSHSEGKPLSPLPTGTSRPNTKKKRRRTSRGVPVGPSGGLSDGYDTTVDQVRGVPPSRQSRKYRSGRSMRARPLNQLTSRSIMKERTVQPSNELAWISTSDGVKLVSIQPLQSTQTNARWHELPSLESQARRDTDQTYTQKQLKELLKLHKELERVEQGLGTAHGGSSIDSTTDQPSTYTAGSHLVSYTPEELALQAFNIPTESHHHPFSLQQSPPTQQMVWSPHKGGTVIRSQPLAPVHLTQLRQHNPNLGVLYQTSLQSRHWDSYN